MFTITLVCPITFEPLKKEGVRVKMAVIPKQLMQYFY